MSTAQQQRTPYIRMDGTRRPSIFANDRTFTGKTTSGARAANAFGGETALTLPGSPPLNRIADPVRKLGKGAQR